jgi:hypothetical protein
MSGRKRKITEFFSRTYDDAGQKRSRNDDDDDGDDQPETYAGRPLSHYYIMQTKPRFLKQLRWKLGVYMVSYTLHNIRRTPDTMSLFIRIMNHFIREADRLAGGNTEMFSCIIDSLHFKKHKHLQVPYRRFDQNCAAAVWNMLDRVQQSHPHVDLLIHPMSVQIVTVPPRPLSFDNGTSGGAGRGVARVVRHNINEKSLIPVPNSRDSLCLFYAVVLTRHYIRIEKTAANCNHFRRLTTKQSDYFERERRRLVDELFDGMRNAGLPSVPLNRDEYSVEKWMPQLQRYYDITEPQEYRLSVFNQHGAYRPVWKGKEVARNELAIVHLGDHFCGIKHINIFFGKAKYCLDCERPYSKDTGHSVSCKSKCTNCCGKGFGIACSSWPTSIVSVNG